MNETYYAGAYWRARRETAEECAGRAQAFFQAMAQCDAFFARWFVPPPSRQQLPTPFEPDVSTLQEMFAQGRIRNDEGGVIEDLGFHLSADNGMRPGKHQGDHAYLRVRCGVEAEPVGNACVLSLPSTGAFVERACAAPMLARVMRAMVLAWEPGWGIATSDTHRARSTERAIVGTFVGWVMYFSRHWGPVPPLPAPVHIEPVEDRGTLIVLTPERFTADNPEHVALAARVRELLDRAGLMKPLP
jgi:Immunity protein 52